MMNRNKTGKGVKGRKGGRRHNIDVRDSARISSVTCYTCVKVGHKSNASRADARGKAFVDNVSGATDRVIMSRNGG